MAVSKTSGHIQIKIKMPNPRQEPPASSKALNQDLKDMDVLCTFKTMIESQQLEHGYINSNDYIQIKIMIPNPSEEHLASSKAPNQDLKDMVVICTFKIEKNPKFGELVYQRLITISKSRS